MIFNENFVDFIKLLNKYEVRYVLVGGWAVIIEGFSRNTSDIDFFIEAEEKNAQKILAVVKDFFGSTVGFQKADFLKDDNILMLGRPPFRIDLLTSISGVDFEEVFENSKVYKDDDLSIRCIRINELIKNKKASGRLKDQLDVEMLEKILKKRNNKKE